MNEWVVEEPNGKGMGYRVGPAWLGHKTHSEETKRQAQLISAAPDLLKALEALVKGQEELNSAVDLPVNWTGDYLNTARDAIAKAKGIIIK